MEMVMNPKVNITMVTILESGYALTRGVFCLKRRKIIIEQR
jgi:hypothetical protein